MKDQYRGFNLYSKAEPVHETLLGHITQWSPGWTIDYTRRNNSVVELARFRHPGMTIDDAPTAERFGLELARLLVDRCYRDFVIDRYETKKRLVQRDRLQR